MAVGALKTVRDAGLHVPGDVSIIGFDDHDMAAYCDLTTVAQPVQQQGETAATLLIEHMNDDTGTHETTSVVLPTKIVVRSTTGPHRSGRADIAAVP
jgi:DNA-binding LacI/PurR family transcriptional regulator